MVEVLEEELEVGGVHGARQAAGLLDPHLHLAEGVHGDDVFPFEEVEEGFVLEDFTIETMPDRINKLGDLWEDFLKHRQVLPPVE